MKNQQIFNRSQSTPTSQICEFNALLIEPKASFRPRVAEHKTEQEIETRAFQLNHCIEDRSDFLQFLKLRKAVFVDSLKWKLTSFESHEIDEFDTPQSYYVVAKIGAQVVAGARLIPLKNSLNSMTTQILNGSMDRIPSSVIPANLDLDGVWEGSRLAISEELAPKSKLDCLLLIIEQIKQVTLENGGNALLTLSPLGLARMLKQHNIKVSQVSQPYTCEEDNRRYASFLTLFEDQSVEGNVYDFNRNLSNFNQPERSIKVGT